MEQWGNIKFCLRFDKPLCQNVSLRVFVTNSVEILAWEVTRFESDRKRVALCQRASQDWTGGYKHLAAQTTLLLLHSRYCEQVLNTYVEEWTTSTLVACTVHLCWLKNYVSQFYQCRQIKVLMTFRGPFFNGDSTFLNVGAYFFFTSCIGNCEEKRFERGDEVWKYRRFQAWAALLQNIRLNLPPLWVLSILYRKHNSTCWWTWNGQV